MLRGAGIVVAAMLLWATPATAGSPSVTIAATAEAGQAPLTVTFQAHGDPASYHWDLGNGQTADGPTASTTYGPGLWNVTVTATAADGATQQASVTVRSEAVTLLPAEATSYRRAVTFQGSIVPALAGEDVSLDVAGREVAAAQAGADGTFELRLAHALMPGLYEAATSVATSAPVSLALHPLLHATFLGERSVGGRLRLCASVTPAVSGTVTIRLYRDGTLMRTAGGRAAARIAVPTDRIADYRAIVRVEPAEGWLGGEQVRRAHVLCTREAGTPGNGLVFRYGSRLHPLLSFAALNTELTARRCGAVRRLATALLSHGSASGDAIYWEYDFPFHGGPVPWRSGFAQAVAAQALGRAGVMLRDPRLTAAAAASFRGLRETLLLPVAGGHWIREYGFTHEVILNSQLQSLLSLESYARLAASPQVARVVQSLYRATVRLLPRFDLGCHSLYELGGPVADRHYQDYHVALLKRLAAEYPAEPVFARLYERWRRCA